MGAIFMTSRLKNHVLSLRLDLDLLLLLNFYRPSEASLLLPYAASVLPVEQPG